MLAMSRYRNSNYTEFQQRGLNVKDFGAKGDGVTDDTAAIQSAINASPSGGTIIFPEGKYCVSHTISIQNVPSLVIDGMSSQRNTKIAWTGSQNGTIFDCVDEIFLHFNNLEFNGIWNGTRTANHAIKLRTLNASTYKTYISNCYFYGFADAAVQIGDYSLSGIDGEVDYTYFENCYFDSNYYGITIDSLQSVDTLAVRTEFIGGGPASGGTGSYTYPTQYNIYLKRAGQFVQNEGFYTGAVVDIYLASGWASLNDIDSETGLHDYGQFLVTESYKQGTLAPGRADKLIFLKNVLSQGKGDSTNQYALDINCSPGIHFIEVQTMANVHLANDCRELINNGLHLLDYSAASGYTNFPANPSIVFQTFGSGTNVQQVTEIYEPVHNVHGTANVTASATSVSVNMITSAKYGFFDAKYTVVATPNWGTTCWITGKQDSGFTINFGTAAPASQTVDWIAVRAYSNRPSAMA